MLVIIVLTLFHILFTSTSLQQAQLRLIFDNDIQFFFYSFTKLLD